MRRLKVLLSFVTIGCAGVLLALSSAASSAQDQKSVFDDALAPAEQATVVAFYDLENGIGMSTSPVVSVITPMADTNADGFYEAVLKVNLRPTTGLSVLNAVLEYEGVPTGYTFNIGDSATNDGHGGDLGTQERDAEMMILDGTMSVYASDVGGSPTNATQLTRTVLGLENCALKVQVGDMFLSHGGAYTEMDFSNCPPGADLLFALGGQPDAEGSVNWDLFVGLNRVIWDAPANGRIGAGLARVYITLE